jgi:hypothetical protein
MPLFTRACETLQQAGVSLVGVDFLFTITPEKLKSAIKTHQAPSLTSINYRQSHVAIECVATWMK